MRLLTILALLLTLGCATSINKKNASNYSQAAISAQKSGNWDEARKLWAKTVVNARLAGASDSTLAVAYYEYGRSLGVTCFFEEAEEYLKLAHEVDAKTNGPVHMDLNELSLLNLDQEKWDSAISYYEKTIKALEKLDAESKAPYALADVLDSYSLALENTNNPKANEYKQRAKALRDNNPGGSSITDRTPYGEQCVT